MLSDVCRRHTHVKIERNWVDDPPSPFAERGLT
jgi:hypothetical protein